MTRKRSSAKVPTPQALEASDAETPGHSRRLFLRTALVGGVLAAGGLLWRADDQGVFTPFEGPAFEAWRASGETGAAAMAAAAVLAASAHNMQNWLLHLTEQRIDLYDDPRRSLGVVDPFRREGQLGLGCAPANLELAGPPAGRAARTTLAPSAGEPDLVASVALTQTTARDDDPLFRAITGRHSDRGPYPDETPAPGLLDRLAATALSGGAGSGGAGSGGGSVQIRWLTSAAARDEAGTLLIDTAQAIIDDEAMSVDGAAWFRNTPGEVSRLKDGLTLDCQALPGLIELAGKMLPPVSREKGDATWVQMTRDTHTATARAYGVVLADGRDAGTRLRAGRALQRLHLALTAEGWAMQHLNQAVEVAEREEATDAAPRIGERLADLVGGARGAQVVAMVRAGRPSGRAAQSPRRPYTDVLV